MEDFTVLGLRVGNLDVALQLLEKSDISIFKNRRYRELSIQQRDQIPPIIQLLNANNITSPTSGTITPQTFTLLLRSTIKDSL